MLAPTARATCSIVAFDPATGDFGVAVQSRFFAVGDWVPFAEAGAGAIATQALANVAYGVDGLDMLRAGRSAQAVVDVLIGRDPLRARRQLGVVDADGKAATHTGAQCLPWAGARVGDHYAVQGNLLAGPEVLDAMAAAFERTSGDLAARLLSALVAARDAGGDVRGEQSAALLVVRAGTGHFGLTDRYIDIQVQDHADPLGELARLLGIRRAQLEMAGAARAL
ncbi:MAG: DUF1028 domain-containing protein, partial [Gammaproteobacteria bacterium]|nr:DUF1028 domain-containing protein [Gammaproteobacteria bacterium]